MMINELKFRELVLYIAERSVGDEKFGATKLNKILFYSDFRAYGYLGAPITGAHYRVLQNGPVPDEMSKIKEELERTMQAVVVPSTYFGYPQQRLISLRAADLSLFTGQEIAIVDQVIQEFEPLNAREVSDQSHSEAAWQVAPFGQYIPYSAVFLSSARPSAYDIQRGQEIANKYGWALPKDSAS